jgi:hypothetical protein
MGGLLSYLIDKDAGLKCFGEIGIGHCAVSSIQSNEFLIDYDTTRLMKGYPRRAHIESQASTWNRQQLNIDLACPP